MPVYMACSATVRVLRNDIVSPVLREVVMGVRKVRGYRVRPRFITLRAISMRWISEVPS